MLSTHRPIKLLWAIVLTALLLLVAIDRGNWANVSQWREDQATNLWLGFTSKLTLLKVGLISSVVAPNPNGMPLAGVLLSRLPGLWWVSLALGAQVISAHLEYRGSFLSEADVPLAHKMEAVDFIARDWKAVSPDPQVAVSYDLGGGKWDFVTGLGFGLENYYPAPMTIGRALDYQLLRVYGLYIKAF